MVLKHSTAGHSRCCCMENSILLCLPLSYKYSGRHQHRFGLVSLQICEPPRSALSLIISLDTGCALLIPVCSAEDGEELRIVTKSTVKPSSVPSCLMSTSFHSYLVSLLLNLTSHPSVALAAWKLRKGSRQIHTQLPDPRWSIR